MVYKIVLEIGFSISDCIYLSFIVTTTLSNMSLDFLIFVLIKGSSILCYNIVTLFLLHEVFPSYTEFFFAGLLIFVLCYFIKILSSKSLVVILQESLSFCLSLPFILSFLPSPNRVLTVINFNIKIYLFYVFSLYFISYS